MRCFNRLTVIGPKQQVKGFQRSLWITQHNAKFIEPLELSERRFVCQFETDTAPLDALKAISRRWDQLLFLLDYEIETCRIKGLFKANKGAIETCILSY